MKKFGSAEALNLYGIDVQQKNLRMETPAKG